MTPRVPYTHQVQMRFSDADLMGHVNNARFLTYLEDARIGLLGQLIGPDGEGAPAGLILARVEIDYRRPITLSRQPVEVDAWVSKIGSKSFAMDYEIRQFEQCAATARSVMVAFDYPSQSTRPLTADEREILQQWVPPDGED